MISPAVDSLIQAFKCLPGVGAKSAQRMALHLLSGHQEQGRQLSQALWQALEQVRQCRLCQMFTEDELCHICASNNRDPAQLCVVQSTSDVMAFEQTSQYQGKYFVLHGILSPIDGITPEKLGIDWLLQRLRQEQVTEVIIATYATAEGEATAHYIAQSLHDYPQIQCTRLAYGIPHGGEFEYLDANTLAQALTGRRSV